MLQIEDAVYRWDTIKVGDGCYLPSKGRDFQAIHNTHGGRLTIDAVVTYPVKVEIFKQFTTQMRNKFLWMRCYLPSKGRDFQAIHNRDSSKCTP